MDVLNQKRLTAQALYEAAKKSAEDADRFHEMLRKKHRANRAHLQKAKRGAVDIQAHGPPVK